MGSQACYASPLPQSLDSVLEFICEEICTNQGEGEWKGPNVTPVNGPEFSFDPWISETTLQDIMSGVNVS